MQSVSYMTVTVNDIPSELYDAKAEANSLLDILNPGDVKEVNINPSFFTNVPFQKGLSIDPNKVTSSGIEKKLGTIGLLKSWNITYNSQKILLGFHGGWHPNNMPKWRRRQFNRQGVQTFRGDNQNDQIDWLLLQLHPQAKQDVLATLRLLKQKGLEVNRKNLTANMVIRNNWLFEFKDQDALGMDSYTIWEKEQEVNEKIKLLQEGHLQILMSPMFCGQSFFNQPTLSKSAAGARAYLVNQVRQPGGYAKMRDVFKRLDTAIEIDAFASAINSGKLKVTDFEVIRTDNGKTYIKTEEQIPIFESAEERAIWIKKQMDGTDGYKTLATYLDELAKSSKSTAKSAKI